MIDRYSGIPLYQQIKEYLVKYIKKNEGHKKIPSENELSKQFNISRPTIREAIDDLVHEGLVEKIPGKGTFIKINKSSIRFVNWQSTEEFSAKPLEYLLHSYKKNNSNLIIENIGIPYKDLIKNLIKLIGYGKAPDIMSMTYLWIPYLANQGSLFSLNNSYTDKLKSDLYPQSLKSITYNNNFYGFNWGNGPHILYYNKDIISECFGSDDINFEYYDELSVYLSKIHGKYNNEIIPFCLPLINNDLRLVVIHFIYIFLFSFKGGIIDENGEIIFNSENNINMFKWLKTFIKNGYINIKLDMNAAREKFANHKMAFFIDGPWLKNIIPAINKINPVNVGYKILPKTPGGLSYSTLSNHVLSISNQCKNKDLAIDIIKFLTMDSNITEYYYKKTGILPSSLSEINNNPAYNDDFGKIVKKQMETALSIPDTYPAFTYVVNFCAKSCREIFNENKNIPSVLNKTAESIKEIFNTNFENF